MNYEVKEQLYEGKAKKVFATNDPGIVMVHYKDDATAGDGEKKGTIRDKGIVNNKLSNALMQKLEKEGIPTHYVEELNDGMSLRGSANQGVHCLTPRWEKEAAELYGKEGRRAEVCVEGDDVFVVGIPQKGAKQLITRALEEQKGPEHCAGGRKGETL